MRNFGSNTAAGSLWASKPHALIPRWVRQFDSSTCDLISDGTTGRWDDGTMLPIWPILVLLPLSFKLCPPLPSFNKGHKMSCVGLWPHAAIPRSAVRRRCVRGAGNFSSTTWWPRRCTICRKGFDTINYLKVWNNPDPYQQHPHQTPGRLGTAEGQLAVPQFIERCR